MSIFAISVDLPKVTSCSMAISIAMYVREQRFLGILSLTLDSAEWDRLMIKFHLLGL